MSGQRGQATVEVVGALPLLAAVALGAGHVLAAGVAGELADHAAEAGAVALLQEEDPREAARRAVPGWARERMSVHVRDGVVAVVLRPPAPVPGTAGVLERRARAVAEP